MDGADFSPGERITHPDFGTGVVLDSPREGYLRAFFSTGERRVPLESVRREVSRTERILRSVEGTPERARAVWLSYEAHALPVMESASALTSARIDLLPHQVVLTHRIATASPRRFLIADEVGLGKTIEAALILRELASRGELHRALMVVPAGLVNNWHRELNEVFNLDFEVFGSEGDITDRKTNAFAKHDRLIASIDTLKRPARIKRLLEAPRWDLVVFDEAHHLTAYRTGGKVRKTENYKLGEALKGHTRDLLMLSATPHQGNHFQFWMLVQLLNPTLFGSPEEMLESRHRLNTVMFRRTKADACRPDGDPLFARRWVHAESFLMRDEERRFYEKLREYLKDGFDLAKRQGSQGRALGFLMAIFQKIAASSFAAVRRTLKRRKLMLTLHEALIRDRDLDIEGRERLYDEARELIHVEWALGRDPAGRNEVDRVMADLKYRLAKKLDEEALEMASDPYGSEFASSHMEDAASAAVDIHLPEERLRIADLLSIFPEQRETKVQKLLDGLGTLWRQNPNEKIVIFATYLGTVDLLAREIEQVYPGQGVVVLRGGDHGAKVAAERRFRQKDGPRVLVCTAAGREGINLQFARVLFNFDLPWNPMDMEQRIGRIHRYGQAHTAQVYNLVLSDTIEGRIFLLLDDKLTEIARTLGKVDDQGNIAEDLRSQILGQLSERLNYDRLYQEALSDPELKRTAVELEAALSNAREAREVVFDLFQDLDGFSLDDYKPFSDVSSGMDRLVQFLSASLTDRNWRLIKIDDLTYDLISSDGVRKKRFTLDRDTATSSENVELLGLDHPLLQEELGRWRSLPPEQLGVAVGGSGDGTILLSTWLVESSTGNGEKRVFVQPIAIRRDGSRAPAIERQAAQFLKAPCAVPRLPSEDRLSLFITAVEPTLQRELKHKGAAVGDGSYSAELIGYIEIV
ncbi:DEAD/DEAH box helicase [Mesorhizobium sp. M1C.F.Ca.ET.193.01.1.1]|uniref:DEAD/DEAH box helicase n=1 Tax=unclassified Mesorhizobium TaxID=325217 RepID=UPI000FD33A03|nr:MULTISPECIES: SNF2-related protein [unclassified Mesorhizobium]TGS91387.1 DEAD/DEAH box helicase [bacterium M00.F.Ca.ET.177.01.1.1]TGQ51536.1 DEAD/DEAH box helicase [Mesorhizobium sp. M1C.F.Ca.ET.210.01.1.1]TGQ67764.1 DEAD/DEAH box helicase [Mesorhizobium sp. M1C.F.Ca.ET.212.01.1.1]TGR02357.1 DEAD/DEAH box helicase [Mesorhizobium sp. M1C.F.Ca.ET.204.01.1.1]TGR22899.1 DEAD/DEAH box helicase [Mesorhizobium sp. M1C.F.Ca.ET.196.01.1.1]